MNQSELIDIAHRLIGSGKGLLAMDESNGTCNKRFAALGIPQTEEERRAYRELLVTTPNLAENISGAILYDETIRQRTKADAPFVEVLTAAGIVPGIKVDMGAKALAGHPEEKVTEGLDGLRERLTEYAGMGARFAKWRAVITIGDGRPSRACVAANAHALARYAALHLPWPLTSSFGRAIQQPALRIWQGSEARTAEAQTMLRHRAICDGAALQGAYSDAMEMA